MNKPGKKSSADLSVVIDHDFGSERPNPPAQLTASQSRIWQDVVGSEAVGFFSTQALQDILVSYCIHKDSADAVSGIIATFEPDWLRSEDGARRYHQLLRMRELETRAMLSCATKLRLTNQARYTPQAASTAFRNKPRMARPWE